jgi:hypothetical protein
MRYETIQLVPVLSPRCVWTRGAHPDVRIPVETWVTPAETLARIAGTPTGQD